MSFGNCSHDNKNIYFSHIIILSKVSLNAGPAVSSWTVRGMASTEGRQKRERLCGPFVYLSTTSKQSFRSSHACFVLWMLFLPLYFILYSVHRSSNLILFSSWRSAPWRSRRWQRSSQRLPVERCPGGRFQSGKVSHLHMSRKICAPSNCEFRPAKKVRLTHMNRLVYRIPYLP